MTKLPPITEPLTVDHVIDAVADVQQFAVHNDYEAAHILEDKLFRRVLNEVAVRGEGRLGELARLALAATTIEFKRVCS